MDKAKEGQYTFEDLIRITARLRSEEGCPWDREQTFASLKKCLADETEEVFQAVDRQDMENLCEELGDILFQVMLNSQIASEQNAFAIEDVIDGICRKMIRRHPHVFGDKKDHTASLTWEQIKALEKAEKAK